MDERAPQKIDPVTKDMVESTVITWLNGDALDGSNLSIQNYEDKEEIKKWVRGVWGRIKHQLEDSGFPFPGGKIMNLAGFYFHDQIKNHPRYEALKPHLPPEVLLYDGL